MANISTQGPSSITQRRPGHITLGVIHAVTQGADSSLHSMDEELPSCEFRGSCIFFLTLGSLGTHPERLTGPSWNMQREEASPPGLSSRCRP